MKKTNKLFDKISVIIAIILVIGLFVGGGIVFANILPVSLSETKSQKFVVEQGMGLNQIAEKLEDEGLIRSALFFKLYLKLNEEDSKTFQAGTYNLSKSMTIDDMIEDLTTGDSIENEAITVTFVEGKRFPYYVTKISQTFDISEESIYNLTSDEEFLDKLIEKYWFIDDSIKQKDIYYPLEGYLFPDTYEFKKSSTAEEIITKMIDTMGSKLDAYKDTITNSEYSAHEILTMASLVELEAITAEDRMILAGVFYNRLNAGMTLGSDVTTYYAAKKELTEKIYQSELNACNAYNTRGTCVKGLPIGPIACPSYSSITAAVNPDMTTKYYYFVADKNNKLYFATDASGHQRNISNLKQQGLWPE